MNRVLRRKSPSKTKSRKCTNPRQNAIVGAESMLCGENCCRKFQASQRDLSSLCRHYDTGLTHPAESDWRGAIGVWNTVKCVSGVWNSDFSSNMLHVSRLKQKMTRDDTDTDPGPDLDTAFQTKAKRAQIPPAGTLEIPRP
jgi:hypothetical protein